jgi:hypothetical protein
MSKKVTLPGDGQMTHHAVLGPFHFTHIGGLLTHAGLISYQAFS